MKYAGIGSRQTPQAILEIMQGAGAKYARLGWTLRSGGAAGADSYFEKGCDSEEGLKEIFLPWKGFNGSQSPLFHIDPRAFEIASSLHPAWNKCSQGAQKLLARNCHQILGANLDDPVDLVLYWCPIRVDGTPMGGTALGVNLARKYGIRTIECLSLTDETK